MTDYGDLLDRLIKDGRDVRIAAVVRIFELVFNRTGRTPTVRDLRRLLSFRHSLAKKLREEALEYMGVEPTKKAEAVPPPAKKTKPTKKTTKKTTKKPSDEPSDEPSEKPPLKTSWWKVSGETLTEDEGDFVPATIEKPKQTLSEDAASEYAQIYTDLYPDLKED